MKEFAMKVTINVVSILAVILIVGLLLKVYGKVKEAKGGCGCGCNGAGSCGTKPTETVTAQAAVPQYLFSEDNYNRF